MLFPETFEPDAVPGVYLSQVNLTFKYRVKGSASRRLLNRMAAGVNLTWNACNDAQRRAVRLRHPWLSAFDLHHHITGGACKLIGLGAETLQAVGEQYVQNRQTQRKRHLRYRGKKSPGWVPFKARGVRQIGDGFRFMGHVFRVWLSRPLGGPIKCGIFSQDAQGNWYINIVCEVPLQPSAPTGAIGIDLGINNVAAMSDGTKLDGTKPFESIEKDLAIAQRARKKKRARALHAKARNRRKDALHKLTTRLVRENIIIAVGNVSTASQLKTPRAKGALDAGWGTIRSQLDYKAIRHSVGNINVNEAYSTQTCSACGAKPQSSPKGKAGLRIETWKCSDCGASHDRDVNAAKNILTFSLAQICSACGIFLPKPRPKGIAGLGIRTWECSDCGASNDAAKNIRSFALGFQRPVVGIPCL
jgi:putative transposase